jgi:hypothetical protein
LKVSKKIKHGQYKNTPEHHPFKRNDCYCLLFKLTPQIVSFGLERLSSDFYIVQKSSPDCRVHKVEGACYYMRLDLPVTYKGIKE